MLGTGEQTMNKLRCILSGGHRYSPSKVISCRNEANFTIKLRNFCVKCGKMIEFEMPYTFIDNEIKSIEQKVYNKGFRDALTFGCVGRANDDH
jgi:hypothetical protein